ncbi:MAG TPA: glutamate--tRNA ligase [Acidimicrobiales bacterium]|nr:glutamate--tRNA ligase [Acidimicrobiales bacterium]
MGTPRVRFAPAPTGFLHVGSARAALFNWLFARHHGGEMALRIEDTDPARSRDELIEGIERALRWLGLDWDGPVVRQSRRMDLYREAATRLIGDGLTYWCDCTREVVAARTGSPATGYDGHCRERGLGRTDTTALRLRTPDDGDTVVHDVIRGDVNFEHETLEDFVVVRADGMPTFLLANAVDDADMGITHVIRGEDLLASTPKVLLLRRALGHTEDPVFAHLPLLVDEKRRKLSKRRHAVAVEEYREKGYLSQAVRNYLGLLGWAPPGDREIVPIAEMVATFDLAAVNKAPAFFDVAKLDHVNAEYLRALPVATFVRESLPWLEEDPPWPPERFELGTFEALAPLVQERVRTLGEVPEMVDFLFLEEPQIDPASWEKAVAGSPAAAAVLDDALVAYADCPWEAEALHKVTAAVGERHGLALRRAQGPIRVAVTGRTVGPPLFESLQVLGREPTLARLRTARERLEPPAWPERSGE